MINLNAYYSGVQHFLDLWCLKQAQSRGISLSCGVSCLSLLSPWGPTPVWLPTVLQSNLAACNMSILEFSLYSFVIDTTLFCFWRHGVYKLVYRKDTGDFYYSQTLKGMELTHFLEGWGLNLGAPVCLTQNCHTDLHSQSKIDTLQLSLAINTIFVSWSIWNKGTLLWKGKILL